MHFILTNAPDLELGICDVCDNVLIYTTLARVTQGLVIMPYRGGKDQVQMV